MSDQGFPNWATEWSEHMDGLADDPREQHEREDFEDRHFDFAVALTHGDGLAALDRTPRGEATTSSSRAIPSSSRDGAADAAITPGVSGPGELSGRIDAHRTFPPCGAGLIGGAGDERSPCSGVAGPVDLQPWEVHAWRAA